RGENDRNLSLLEELEARDQLAVEGDGFAVEKDRAHRQRADGGGNVGEARAARLSRPRDEAHVAAFLVREDAVAVVLLLVDPARAMEGLVDQGGEHRARAERDAVARAFAGRRAHPLTGWRARPLAFARDRGRADAPSARVPRDPPFAASSRMRARTARSGSPVAAVTGAPPSSNAISASRRPDATERGRVSATSSPVAASSRCLMRSQLRSARSPPRRRPRSTSGSSGTQRPRSQIIIVPPPYSPAGITPSNSS